MPSFRFCSRIGYNGIYTKGWTVPYNGNLHKRVNRPYPRNLYLSFGNLQLKIPRVRIGHSFRPAILPERWKRVDKDYEELLIAMLANGYSKAQI